MPDGASDGPLAPQNPWERTDAYGAMGLAPQPFPERIRLAMCAVFLVPIKCFGALVCLLSYFVVIKASCVLPDSVRTDWVAALGKIHCRACLFCLGFVRIEWIAVPREGAPAPLEPAAGHPAVGIVSNHSSWVDILIHMSHSFPSFVARDATKHTPIIGSISQAMGCIYVDRSKRPADSGQPGVAALVKERMVDAAAGRLPHARPMLLFPEGTTTNGSFMLPFKTGAFLAGAPLQPVIIRYRPGRFSLSWETIKAPRHIFLTLCTPIHMVTCYELPVHVPSAAEREDPRAYADAVRADMMAFAGLKDSHETYEDKLVYWEELRAKHGLPPGRPLVQPGSAKEK